MGSEVGLVDTPFHEIVESGRLGPGEMIAIDNERGRFLHTEEIARELVEAQPYAQWVDRNLVHLMADDRSGMRGGAPVSDILAMEQLHGYTREEIETVIKPMARDGKEPVGSMGDDTPLSALQNEGRLLYTYFKQRFAQVTNPAIDSIREEIVMSLDMYLGRRCSVLETARRRRAWST